MMIEHDILRRTNYGLSIYRLVLKDFYPIEDPIHFTGEEIDLVKNPFNNHRKTLKLVKEELAYRFSDIEQPEFAGGPFEFAAKHYKIEGMPLFQLLNHVMRMNLDVRYFKVHAVASPRPKPIVANIVEPPRVEVPQFSFFRAPIKNVRPLKNITVPEAYELIKTNAYARVTSQLRGLDNPEEARAFKASQFSYVTFSGVFNNRKDSALSSHSGLVTIDFDHVDDVQRLKALLLDEKRIETALLFVSPSGKGLKWIIKKNRTEMGHTDFFMAVAHYIRKTYQINIDPSGKDVSRACFLPYDPEVFIHPKYLTA